MKHTDIRKKFLKFFESKGHRVVASDSLVPADDPTLLFTSAGMNQFKNEFMGNIKDFTRATSSQKCLRTADLENVGKTAYHHTFFEMLGNFSFGDYFKKEAIQWAWEFITQKLKVKTQKLWASVYEEDDEAYGIWKDIIGLAENRIVKLGEKENFWPSEAKTKGPNGPCGPCSEIFYDYGEETGCGKKDCSPACDCGRFVEIWNLVFTQYNRKEGGKLDALPNKNIDTGMGLERLCAVMQGKRNNFETDLFTPIIEAIKNELRITDYDLRITNIYAIADHIRAVTFAIADGVTPSNEERGYVIRKIINKAALHARNIGIEEPFLYKLVYTVGKVMKEPYPEILKRNEDIARVIKFEEERFASTLDSGLRLLEETISDLKKHNTKTISGEKAFTLFDRHGLPLFLIQEVALKEGLGVDEEGFNVLMESQREQSRKKSKLKGEVFVESDIKEKSEFIGYDKESAKAKVLRILNTKAEDMPGADKSAGKVEIILDKSVFYGESGGQAGDAGNIDAKGLRVRIDNAKKIQDAIMLEGIVLEGEIKTGDTIQQAVDIKRRLKIAKNHTATHLLQSALRRVLGEHVQQQGSFVGVDYLRFDFYHNSALTDQELERTEELVNEYINKATPIKVNEMSIEDAKRSGALAFFGEKYGQKVRVVAAGDYSKELCGGTHLDNTKDIGLFKIMREGSVASGIRRIEACTAKRAEEWVELSKEKHKEAEDALRRKENEKKLFKEKLKEAEKDIDKITANAEDIAGTKLIVSKLEDANVDMLKRINDIIRRTIKSELVLFLAAVSDGRCSLLLSASDGLVKKGIDSGKLIADIAKRAGGSGGGRPNIALGGIKDINRVDDILKEAKAILTREIK